ncbi:MAG: Flagellar and Swarming motility protein [Pedosphaera sp.]|nr:Flagellar and Swarming motility protein [Pedosphaera sp.]
MPLIKLSRINKGGEIFLNSEQIRFIEIESGSTTLNMGPGNVYAVQETPQQISDQVEEMESLRISRAIRASGLGADKI